MKQPLVLSARRHLIISVAALALLLGMAAPVSVYAANTNITGGTNGPLCNSGGYFTPSSVTISSGDTVTISVPADDPYAGGVQVHNFPGGNFTVLPGDSHTTGPLTADVSYYGTWPSTGCMKGTGTITVSAPAPAPTPKPTPTPPASTKPQSKTPTTTTPAPTTTQPTTTTNTSDTTPAKTTEPAAKPAAPTAQPKKMMTGLGPVATVGGGVIAVLAIAAFLVWRLVLQRKLPHAAPVAPAQTAVMPPPSDVIQPAPPAGTGTVQPTPPPTDSNDPTHTVQ